MAVNVVCLPNNSQFRRDALAQVFAVTDVLLFGRASCHIVCYEDYCSPPERVLRYAQGDELFKFVQNLLPKGGGDAPEASKTGLVDVLKRRNPSKATLVFHYTDAAPHHKSNDTRAPNQSNALKELKALGAEKYDWIWLCNQYRELGIPVYTLCHQVCIELNVGCVVFHDSHSIRKYAKNIVLRPSIAL
jgi:hypothetical protein